MLIPIPKISTEKEFVVPVHGMKCENCNAAETVNVHIDFAVCHFWMVPFFSMERELYTSCIKCGMGYRYAKAPDKIKSLLLETSKTKRTPVKHFIGVIGIAGIILLVFLSQFGLKPPVVNLKNKPIVGDYYGIKLAADRYTVYRVNRVTKDSLFFTPNKIEGTFPEDIRLRTFYTAKNFADSISIGFRFRDLIGYKRKLDPTFIIRGAEFQAI